MHPGRSGPVTATRAVEVRTKIADPDRGIILDIHNVRWTVEKARCHVTAHWLADVNGRGTHHHATRFMITDGLIQEIEDIWVAPNRPGAIEGSCWPKLWPDAEDEAYRLAACPKENRGRLSGRLARRSKTS